MTKNARKIRWNSCLLIFHKTETFFIGKIGFLTPKNIYIDTNFVTLTALELKLWHKRWFPDFDGGHFENGPKQVVHPNFFLMASTFDIRRGPMNNKNLVSDCPGRGCTVTLSGPWTNMWKNFQVIAPTRSNYWCKRRKIPISRPFWIFFGHYWICPRTGH